MESNMEVISREKYMELCNGGRDGYFRLDNVKLNRLKFSVGDVVHIIDYHYLEDEHGNDIDQDVLFVNPSIITGVYRITGIGCLGEDDYEAVAVQDVFCEKNGCSAEIGGDIIYENYVNSGLV